MRMTLGIEKVSDNFYTILVEELSEYANCTVTKDGEDVTVQMEGDLVACSCVVAVCDKYRFSRDLILMN